MPLLFLHGWQSTPGGVKPTFLKDHGHTVLNPALPDDDFDAAVALAQAEFDRHHPDVVVGSSRGGAVAMNIKSGDTPLVLLCPAWKRWGTATTVKPNTVILHSKADEIVPFSDSEELVRNSGLPSGSLIDVGHEHRLADEESLKKMVEVVEKNADNQRHGYVCHTCGKCHPDLKKYRWILIGAGCVAILIGTYFTQSYLYNTQRRQEISANLPNSPSELEYRFEHARYWGYNKYLKRIKSKNPQRGMPFGVFKKWTGMECNLPERYDIIDVITRVRDECECSNINIIVRKGCGNKDVVEVTMPYNIAKDYLTSIEMRLSLDNE